MKDFVMSPAIICNHRNFGLADVTVNLTKETMDSPKVMALLDSAKTFIDNAPSKIGEAVGKAVKDVGIGPAVGEAVRDVKIGEAVGDALHGVIRNDLPAAIDKSERLKALIGLVPEGKGLSGVLNELTNTLEMLNSDNPSAQKALPKLLSSAESAISSWDASKNPKLKEVQDEASLLIQTIRKDTAQKGNEVLDTLKTVGKIGGGISLVAVGALMMNMWKDYNKRKAVASYLKILLEKSVDDWLTPDIGRVCNEKEMNEPRVYFDIHEYRNHMSKFYLVGLIKLNNGNVIIGGMVGKPWYNFKSDFENYGDIGIAVYDKRGYVIADEVVDYNIPIKDFGKVLKRLVKISSQDTFTEVNESVNFSIISPAVLNLAQGQIDLKQLKEMSEQYTSEMPDNVKEHLTELTVRQVELTNFIKKETANLPTWDIFWRSLQNQVKTFDFSTIAVTFFAGAHYWLSKNLWKTLGGWALLQATFKGSMALSKGHMDEARRELVSDNPSMYAVFNELDRVNAEIEQIHKLYLPSLPL